MIKRIVPTITAIFIAVVVSACSNNHSSSPDKTSDNTATAKTTEHNDEDSSIVNIFKADENVEISEMINVLGDPSEFKISDADNSYADYYWQNINFVYNYPGDLTISTKEDKIIGIYWKTTKYLPNKAKELATIFIENFDDGYKVYEVSDYETNYNFYNNNHAVALINHAEDGYTEIYTNNHMIIRETESEL